MCSYNQQIYLCSLNTLPEFPVLILFRLWYFDKRKQKKPESFRLAQLFSGRYTLWCRRVPACLPHLRQMGCRANRACYVYSRYNGHYLSVSCRCANRPLQTQAHFYSNCLCLTFTLLHCAFKFY